MTADAIHPLAARLIAETPRGSRVLLIGVGSGRHIPPLLAAGLRIDAIEEDAERAEACRRRFAADADVRIAHASYDRADLCAPVEAALATHVFQHGTADDVRRRLAALDGVLARRARAYLAFGSARDPRLREGRALDARTRVPTSGREVGVPHLYLDEPGLRTMLSAFTIRRLVETHAAPGAWAHDPGEARRMVHWYVEVDRAR